MAASLMSSIVEIRPDLDGFRKATMKGVADVMDKVEKDLNKGLGSAADRAGDKMGRELGAGIEDGVTDASVKAGKTMERELGAAADRTGKTMADRTAKMASMGNRLSLAVTAPVILGIKKAGDAFSNYQDQLGALGVNYGEQAKAISDWADTTAAAYMISRDEALGLANGLAPMVQQFTAVSEQADVTTEAIGRVGDMASMFGGTAEEAATALVSFLSGSSTEPIRKYGVFASEAAVALKAVDMGLVKAEVSSAKFAQATLNVEKAEAKVVELTNKGKKGTREYEDAVNKVALAQEALSKVQEGKMPTMSEAVKLEARMALFMEQTSRAQGDATRTADSYANKQKAATTEMRNAAIEAGEALAPAMTKVFDAVSTVAQGFANLPSSVQTGIVALVGISAAIGPIMRVIAMMAQLRTANQLAAISAGQAASAQAAVGTAGGVGGLGGAGAAGKVGAGLAGIAGLGMVFGSTRADQYKGGEALSTIAGATMFGAAVGSVVPGVGTGFGAAVGAIGGTVIAGTRLAGLAEGGITTSGGSVMVGERGPEILTLPRGAEVRPLDKVGGDTYNINVSVTGRAADDPKALAKELDAIARRARATQGRTRRPDR